MVKSSSLKKFRNTITSSTISALPVINTGLKKVGTITKDVAVKTLPIVENGVSVVYGTIAKGTNLGVKGVQNVAKGITKRKRSRRHRKSRRRHTHRHS